MSFNFCIPLYFDLFFKGFDGERVLFIPLDLLPVPLNFNRLWLYFFPEFLLKGRNTLLKGVDLWSRLLLFLWNRVLNLLNFYIFYINLLLQRDYVCCEFNIWGFDSLEFRGWLCQLLLCKAKRLIDIFNLYVFISQLGLKNRDFALQILNCSSELSIFSDGLLLL